MKLRPMFMKTKEDCDITVKFIKILDTLRLDYAGTFTGHPWSGHTKYGSFVIENYLKGKKLIR